MILNFLIAIWTICAAAGAAPQYEYGSTDPTVTVYAPCPDTTPFSIISSNRMAHISGIPADTTLYYAPTIATYPSLQLSKSTGTIETSQLPKSTGKLETSELSNPAQPTILSQTSSNIYAFVVISGTTSWLNGQTPTSNPSQSFVVVTSAITVVPLSTPPPLPSASNSESVILSTATVIPLPTHPSSTKTSSGEPVVISTATVVPLSTLPPSSASQLASTSELPSSNEPLVVSTETVVPLMPTPTPASSPVETSILVVPISSSALTSWTSALPSAANITSVISSSAVKTSSVPNLSSAASNSSTIAESSSSIPSVSSPTISKPESIWSIVEPVTSASSSPTPSNIEPSIFSTTISNSKPASILANSTSTLVPSPTFSQTTTATDLSALASSAEFTGSATGINSTSTQSASGKVYTGMASVGGWNKTSSMGSESSSFDIYTSFTIGTLTTLTAAAGFKDSNQTSASNPSSTGSALFPASLTTSAAPLTSTTSISRVVSIPGMIPVYNATWTTKKISMSGPSTMSSLIPIFNATSLSNSTSISSSISISKTTSMYHSTPLTTPAPISSFISMTLGPSSVTSLNSTSVTSTSIVASATPSNCGEQGDFVLNFDDVPPLSVSNASDTDVQPEPLFNPYHQFLFSDGFTVVPPPKRLPFLPSSSPLLLEFIPNFDFNSSNKETGPNAAEHGFSGQIGSGDEGFTGCFNFNLYGASLGCDSRDAACDFTFTGYSYDVASKKTSQVAQQVVNAPACPELSNCVLTSVDLGSSFRDLTYFFMNVTVAGKPKLWWMDDLRLGWFDNSCITGVCRQKTHLQR
ncbi:hypothetical protein OCU04_007787 [Sclerotinia nivalis]|uniref:DUF7371 domain-containing protein n=1 Tax=Sclerotinia nivalis TaxID=352851 RepID=A0A9X0AKE7_9HELO|nr:hypothetical protein OCU04_007787 [Sclerotinia nivalis]